MLAILLSLAAAAGFGGSDFAAGLAARGASVIRVTIMAEVTASVVGLLIIPWVSSERPSLAAVGWGAVAGVSGVAGAIALYLGFRHAAFSVASSLSAVGSAALSVLAGLLLGERPGMMSLVGIVLALPAIAAVSASPGQPAPGGGPAREGDGAARDGAGPSQDGDGPAREGAGPAPEGGAGVAAAGPGIGVPTSTRPANAATGRHLVGVGYGLAAGAGFALYFVGLSRAGSGRDLWPVLVAQFAALAVAGCAGAVSKQLRLPPARAMPLAVVTGAAGVAGTLLFFLATHAGLLAVTAVITSLYPAGTILLARLLLGERLTPVRLGGLCLAASSVALIAVGGVGQ
jgi:drug/metabolite transporter (DMT)-like permease